MQLDQCPSYPSKKLRRRRASRVGWRGGEEGFPQASTGVTRGCLSSILLLVLSFLLLSAGYLGGRYPTCSAPDATGFLQISSCNPDFRRPRGWSCRFTSAARRQQPLSLNSKRQKNIFLSSRFYSSRVLLFSLV